MREIFETAAARNAGLITASALRELGVGPHTVEALVARGELVRIRYGTYVDALAWGLAKPEERYQFFVRATMLLAGRPVAVSHMSAAVLLGLPTIGGWPKVVHTIDPGATGGSRARFTTRHRNVPAPDTVRVGELTVTSLARTLIDVAATNSFLVGVTMIDHALRVEQERAATAIELGIQGTPALTKEDLYAELAAVNPRAGAKRAERAITFGNGLAMNPGESLSRVRIFELGFEVPELQVCFPNIGGHDYWVDFFWRRIRKIGEFDGKHKFTRGAILGDRDPGEVAWAEKRRQDALTPYSDSFTRWDWDIAISARLFYAFLAENGVPRA